ncbi:hypothetical protein OO013_04105 [Mangrovivirga sp. M17]|uniref:Uncharacterized protein n=1 Tax=Mangrovivirga halotolerans TaxID=2993936 RepID=A0ABT3RMI0_9BACT|nr:hypothetical protein [Mangrovivirga halotolerans]MCX2743033.1 hypothetical protein [Mangrovivirga halotolerans]
MIRLIQLEYKTLVKGFLFVTVVVFPFTFLPVLFKDGDLLNILIHRIPSSLLYSALFSLFLIFAAVAHNWSNLKERLKYFSKPAFTQLGFEYQMEGQGSLTQDLSPRLYGVYQNMPFKIDIHFDLEYEKENKILIIPITTFKGGARKAFAFQRLKKEFKVIDNGNILAVMLPLDENKLNDPHFLTKNLTLIANLIKREPAINK